MDGWRGSWWGRRRRGHAQLSIDGLARLRAGEVCESVGRGGRGMSGAGSGSELLGGSLFNGGAIVGGGRHARGAPVRPRRSRDRRRRRGLRRSRPRRRVVVLLWMLVVVHGDCAIAGPSIQLSQSALLKCVESEFGSERHLVSHRPFLCSFLPKIAWILLSIKPPVTLFKPRSCDILATSPHPPIPYNHHASTSPTCPPT
jgi:hypothetical protein